MIVLGLTGSIGMGKTEVARMFRSLGVPIFDADDAVHALYAKGGAAVGPIGAAFPEAVIAGTVDRERLSELVVGDEAAIKRLESIVHPLVGTSRNRFMQQAAAAGAKLVVMDIPLLYETGGQDRVDCVAVVSAPHAVQRERVLARPAMTAEKFEAILARQMPDAEKRARADFAIATDTSLAETLQQVRAIVKLLADRQGRIWPADDLLA